MRSRRRLLAAAFVLACAGLRVPATAQEPAPPLRLTVHPSGIDPVETLEGKLARRLRDSDYLFRHICRGCDPADTAAAAPFNPLDALRRPKGAGEASAPRPDVAAAPP